MLSPTAAAVKLASLREKLDELGRKVLIVEKARDSGYQENDYISIKIKKVNGQTDLADEKLAQIKQFKKKIEEMKNWIMGQVESKLKPIWDKIWSVVEDIGNKIKNK